MNEVAAPAAEQTAGKPLWTRPAFETLALEQTLNGASNTTDTSPVSKS